MRVLFCILLLSPGVVLAGAYKCVVGGETTYSQFPCGKNAQEVPNQIVVVPAQMPVDKRAARTPAANAPAAQDAAPQSAAAATAESGSDCKARMQSYLDAQNCFNRFRRSGGALTGDATECPNIAYPSDCTAP